MPTVDINDTTIHYERQGDGPGVLFVHGMCGNADVWADQAGRLTDRYTCVRYDRRGHSRSRRGEQPVSDALHADDAAALIEALDLAPCLYIGSSSGAAFGVEVALRHGHLLRGAVLSEPPLLRVFSDLGEPLVRDLMPRLESAIAAGGQQAWVDPFFERVCPGLWALIDEDRKDCYRANADVGMADLASPSLDIDPAELAAIDVPVLVLAGADTDPSLREIARRLSAVMSDARHVELADCGHVTYAEQPDAFARAVSVFAEELDHRNATAGR